MTVYGSTGLDIGTTGCKGVDYNDQGEALAYAYKEYPTYRIYEGYAVMISHISAGPVRHIWILRQKAQLSA